MARWSRISGTSGGDAIAVLLRMKSAGDHSTIAKEATIRLSATAVLRWDWKVVAFPDGAA